MIDLETAYPAGTVIKSGGDTFEVAAEKTLKIETSPGGVTYLNGTVPSGKKWIVHVIVKVEEVDI
jgi:hypothetical protein